MALTNPLASETACPSGGAGARGAMVRDKRRPFGKSRSGTPLVLDRVLPNSLDAEMAVLGAMLLSPRRPARRFASA